MSLVEVFTFHFDLHCKHFWLCYLIGNMLFCKVITIYRSSRPEVLPKNKAFLEISQNSQESTCARVSFSIKFEAVYFIKKETLAQVFSCKLFKIYENIFSHRTPLVAASEFKVFIIYIARHLLIESNICSKLLIKNPEERHSHCSGVFILSFEHISLIALVFLLLTLNK